MIRQLEDAWWQLLVIGVPSAFVVSLRLIGGRFPVLLWRLLAALWVALALRCMSEFIPYYLMGTPLPDSISRVARVIQDVATLVCGVIGLTRFNYIREQMRALNSSRRRRR